MKSALKKGAPAGQNGSFPSPFFFGTREKEEGGNWKGMDLWNLERLLAAGIF